MIKRRIAKESRVVGALVVGSVAFTSFGLTRASEPPAAAEPGSGEPSGYEEVDSAAGGAAPSDAASPAAAATLAGGPRGATGSADTAAAEALFQLGKALMDRGEIAQACGRFAASMRAEPASGTLLNLARCHELEGKLASAWAEYRKAADLVRALGQPERADEAMRFAVELEPRLSRLTVTPQRPQPGLRVVRDGVEVAPGAWGVAVPVDPGEHRLEATAPGYRTWSTTVRVGATADRQTVSVPPLGALPAARRQGAAGLPAEPSYRVPYFTGIAMVATGGLAVGIGAILGGVAASDVHAAEADPALCGPDRLCTPAGQELIETARDEATAATLLIGVGAATVAGGIVLVLTTGTFRTAPAGEHAAAGGRLARFAPHVGPGRAGLSFAGVF